MLFQLSLLLLVKELLLGLCWVHLVLVEHRLGLLVHVALLRGLLLGGELLLVGLELLLTLLEAEHLLLLLQLLGLWLLLSLVVNHLDIAEAEVAHLVLSVLLRGEVSLGLRGLLSHLGEVWLRLVLVLLDIQLHR